MNREEIFREELIIELKKVYNMMKDESDLLKKIYYFSAAYGITNRTLRYDYRDEYVIADLVLSTSYNMLQERVNNIKRGDNLVEIEETHLQRIEDSILELSIAFENEESLFEPLKKMASTVFSLTGPGNYIREKGMMDF